MKIKLLLCLLGIVWSVSVFSETVYKTRDAEGNIIFSDVPSEGAEEIIVEEPQTINIPKPKRSGNRPTTKLSPEEINYTQLKIISPENDATIRSNEGKVDINVEIMPTLDAKHRVEFLMDGKKVSSGKSLQLSLQDLDRGTHTVTALIKNEKDKVLKRSNKLTFHLRKDSVLFKNREKKNEGSAGSAATTPPDIPVIPAL